MMHRCQIGPLEVSYDDSARAAYVYLPNNTREIGCAAKTIREHFDAYSLLLDVNADGELIGVEILLPVKPVEGG